MPKETTPSLDFLTRYRKQVDVGEDTSKQTFYIKALSDTELTDQENFALIASHTLRRALRQENTPAYLAHISVIDDLDDDELDLRIVARYAQVAWFEVWTELPDSNAVATNDSEPSSDPLETRENDLVDALDADAKKKKSLEKQRTQLHKTKVDDKKLTLTYLSRDKKIKEAKRVEVQEQANLEYRRAFRQVLAALCAYSDKLCTQKIWGIERVHNVPPQLVSIIAEEYEGIGSVPLPYSTMRL